MSRSKIIGTGMKVPKYCMTNEELSTIVDTSDEWIRTRTGIKTRYIVKEGETCVGLALEASKQALESAKISAKELDLVIFASLSPNKVMPSSACELARGLGATKIPAFDLTAACSGFVYALSVADQYIRSGMYRKILCVGAEILSAYTNFEDRSTCVLFGDGAGAVVLSDTDDDDPSIVLSTHLYTENSQGDLLCIPASGSEITPRNEKYRPELAAIMMKGRELYKFAVTGMIQAGLDALEANNMRPEDVDLLIPHQANVRIIEAVRKRLKFPLEKTMINVDKYGNTSAATIPIALHEAFQEKRCQKGDVVLLASFGGGLTYASALLRV